MSAWNWLDWVLAAVVIISILTAIQKGFVQELISLGTFVAALVVAALGYQRAALWFDDLTKSHAVAQGMGFLALFVAVLIVGALLAVLARKLIKTAGIQWFDRFLGGIFGLVRGVLMDSVLLMVLVSFAIKLDAVEKSDLAPYVTIGARVIALAMPENMKAQFSSGILTMKTVIAPQEQKKENKK